LISEIKWNKKSKKSLEKQKQKQKKTKKQKNKKTKNKNNYKLYTVFMPEMNVTLRSDFIG